MQSTSTEAKKLLKDLSIEQISHRMGYSTGLLEDLASHSEVMYQSERPGPKKSDGTYRLIDPPKQIFKPFLRRLNRILTSCVKVHPSAHGGVTGRSSFTSARCHLGARFLVTRDITDCYPSITPRKLFKAFRKLGASIPFASFLSNIMTVREHLPQGGPLSSLAINLFFWRIDDYFYKKVRKNGGHYGRLADDFVISVPSREKAISIGRELDKVTHDQGLKISERKRERRGLMAGDQRKVIHSLIVNSSRGLQPIQEHRKKALDLAESYSRHCKCATPNDLKYLLSLRQRVTGWMYYQGQAEFSPSRHIRWMVINADKQVLTMLKKNGLFPHKDKWWLENELERLSKIWLEKNMQSRVAG